MNNLVKQAELFVQERLANEPTGHDWWHANRVRNLALRIQETEGGNENVIELAALLHDVGDRKVIKAEHDDYSIASNFLRSQHVGAATLDAVLYVIENISFSKSLDAKVPKEKPLELQIVQDADRFDALGAIGIARAFAYGGANGRPLYSPDDTPHQFTSAAEYKSAQGSTLHHFDEKLFLLINLFNTETAKQLAKSRDEYMHEFYNKFLQEWNGIV